MFSFFKDPDYLEQEQAPTWKEIVANNLSMEKGLLHNVAFGICLVVMLSTNISVRNLTSKYRAQSELINKDIKEILIERDASLYKMENLNKKENIINTLHLRNIDIHESNTPNRIIKIN